MRLIGDQVVDIASFNGATGDIVLMQRLEDWFPNYSGWITIIGNGLYLNGTFVANVSAGVK